MKIENEVLLEVNDEDIVNGELLISDSVIEIGDYAFNNCETLESFNVNEENKYYSSEYGVLFNKDKTKLIRYPKSKKDKKYTIPDTVFEIIRAAFDNCKNLTSVFIPNSVTKIGNYAFVYCNNLESIEIPSSVTEIGFANFSNCANLESIKISDSITEIGFANFFNCNNLKSIYIPNSIIRIGYGAFDDCKKLQSKKGNYKAFEKGLVCNNMQYIPNEWNEIKGDIKVGKWGLHYVTNLFDVFNDYFGDLEEDIEIWEVKVGNIVVNDENDSKKATNSIKPVKKLSREEIITILNNN